MRVHTGEAVGDGGSEQRVDNARASAGNGRQDTWGTYENGK